MDKRDVHYFPVCSFCKFPHDRLEPCPVADKVIEELVHPPCPSCAAKDVRIEELESQGKDWIRWKEIAMSRIAALEKVAKAVQNEMDADWGMPESVRAALSAAGKGCR